jgi:hypothetical protein
MFLFKSLFNLATVSMIFLGASAHAAHFTVSLEGNIFDSTPAHFHDNDLGARVGIHAALAVPISKQVDWRFAASVLPFPNEYLTATLYSGPELKFTEGNTTPYLGTGLGIGTSKLASSPAERNGSEFFPYKVMVWAGYRFEVPNDGGVSVIPALEGYMQMGTDNLIYGVRLGIGF